MATHILSSFSIKKHCEIENLLDGLLDNDTITIIKSIYSIWPLLVLMTYFNLPCKASQEPRSTSWGIKAHSSSNYNFKLSTESWGVLQTLLSRIDHTEKSRGFKSGLLEGHSYFLMNTGMLARIQLWVILEPCDGAESCWRVQAAPSKCWRAQGSSSASNMSVRFHSWRYKKEWRSPMRLWLPPTPSQKVDSGVSLLSCLPLIHLYSKLHHFGGLGIAERQIFSRQLTANWAPFRLSWDSECVDICQVSYVQEWLKIHAFSAFCKDRFGDILWGFDALRFDLFLLLQPFLQQNDVNSFSTFPSYFSPDASFGLFVFCPGLVGRMFRQFPWTF